MQYSDPTAFILPPSGTLGNLGRGALIGPNLRTFVLSAVKNTRLAWLGESTELQLRIEAFNLQLITHQSATLLGTCDGLITD